MGCSSKSFSLLIILILAVSIIIEIKPIFAQSLPKPSVPEFTLKYVDYSYDVPPVYGTNPYKGNITVKETGYRVCKEYIDVWVKNPSFQKYTDDSNHKIVLGYDVQWKGHYGNEWANATYPEYLLSSGLEYTVISFAFGHDTNDNTAYYG
jgi:hypothetical protein